MGTSSTHVLAFVLLCTAFVRAAPADLEKRLREADRLAWLTDWYTALPIYAEVENAATAAGDRRDAMYAEFGRLRGQMQTRPLGDISEQIASDLESPLAKGDARLRLRGLTVKGDIDLEWNVQAAARDWERVRQLAKELTDAGWANRANGELAMVAFLKGNTGEATTLVRGALEEATRSGDVGGQLRYMGAIANGLLLAGYAPLAMGYVDRALKFSSDHPEVGFPFVVYSTKVLTLMALNQPDEAERFAKATMAEARAGDRRIKEIELSMMLAQIAETRGHGDEAVNYLEQAAASAKIGHVQRLLADAEAGLADAYRARGDLMRARNLALSAVKETELTGTTFTLPIRLGVLAGIDAAQGKIVEADRVYDQAIDIIEGIMVNVPSRGAQARLIGVMSDLYTEHFRLAADRLNNPAKAYSIVERARGRVLADVLRTLPGTGRQDSARLTDQTRTIAQLQVHLMRATTPATRRQTLDALWEAEQRSSLPRMHPLAVPAIAKTQARIQAVQRNLAIGELILEYVLTAPNSYCLAITRASLKVVPLPSKKQIEGLADRFTTDVRSGAGGAHESRMALYDAVMRPIGQLEAARRVFVVPDGRLHVVPFDSLTGLNSARERIVTIVPSVSVFYLLRTTAKSVLPERPLLAIGGVPYDQVFANTAATAPARRSDDGDGLFDAAYPAKLPVLASAQAEVLRVAQLLGPRSVVLTGEQATEAALKAQNLGSFDILHFAVHAFAEPKFPERAALVLLSDLRTGDDGLLQPREIGRLKLNASVVVLSACDTAVGPTLGQEGILNIARAFLVAGAKSVVTTLWAVGDAASTALMTHFYENIAAGQDVAEALTHGKRTVVQDFGADAQPTVDAFQLVGLGDHRLMVKRQLSKKTFSSRAAVSCARQSTNEDVLQERMACR